MIIIETAIYTPYQGINGKHLVNDFSPGARLGRGFFHKALALSLFI